VSARRLHLVDGTYELFRAHYSKRPDHRAPGGAPAKATVGLAASLLALLHEEAEAVTHIAIAFDNPIVSFRNALYAGYKTDEGMDPELRGQFDAAEDAARALGVVVWSMKEWEADDALATAAARFAGDFDQVRILSPDKDLGQCLRGRAVVQVLRKDKLEIDEAAFRARRGVAPASMPDLQALVGDDADGYPGLPGFGEKSAALLVAAYGRIEEIPADPARWPVKPRGAEKLAATLAARRGEALLYKKLATLVADVPLAESAPELRWAGVPRARFLDWCDRLGVTELRERPRRFDERASS
jgi:5'-3' exonuclease